MWLARGLLKELEGEKVGICVSGGLDSKTVATRLRQYGVDCVCFTADLAQPDEENIEQVREKMAPTGVDTHIVDLKDDMADACCLMVRAQAMYDGGALAGVGGEGGHRDVGYVGAVPQVE